jgi:hypothetical protein
MRRVIKKDLILNRNVILINMSVFAAALAFFAVWPEAFSPRAYAGFSSLMVSFVPISIVTREDKVRAMALGCSLPVSRRTIVKARYSLALTLALAGVVGAFLLGVFVPFSKFALEDLFAPGPILVGLAGMILIQSFLLPFTLRFGVQGVMIFLIASQILGVVLLTIVKVTGSVADVRLVDGIVAFLARLHQAVGPVGFSVLLAAALLGLLGVSYLVSVRIFERREL